MSLLEIPSILPLPAILVALAVIVIIVIINTTFVPPGPKSEVEAELEKVSGYPDMLVGDDNSVLGIDLWNNRAYFSREKFSSSGRIYFKFSEVSCFSTTDVNDAKNSTKEPHWTAIEVYFSLPQHQSFSIRFDRDSKIGVQLIDRLNGQTRRCD